MVGVGGTTTTVNRGYDTPYSSNVIDELVYIGKYKFSSYWLFLPLAMTISGITGPSITANDGLPLSYRTPLTKMSLFGTSSKGSCQNRTGTDHSHTFINLRNFGSRPSCHNEAVGNSVFAICYP